jgi:hypothetical protein
MELKKNSVSPALPPALAGARPGALPCAIDCITPSCCEQSQLFPIVMHEHTMIANSRTSGSLQKGCGSECPSCYPSGPSKKNEVHGSNRSSCQNNFTDPRCTEGRTAHAHCSFCFNDTGTQAPSACRIAQSHPACTPVLRSSLSRFTSRRWPRYAAVGAEYGPDTN